MSKKFRKRINRPRKNVDLHDINELVEMGLKQEEISKELGVSENYIKKILDDYYKDY